MVGFDRKIIIVVVDISVFMIVEFKVDNIVSDVMLVPGIVQICIIVVM